MVACRQLGYPTVNQVYTSAYFGQGSGRIWMDELSCHGYESSLSDCSHSGFGRHDCSHYEDAGVACGAWTTTGWYTTTETTPFTQPTQLNCTFDYNTCGYTQGVNDDLNWTRHRGSTGSTNTGPSGDHTNGLGWYMYVETSSPVRHNDRALLYSSKQDSTGYWGFCLIFYYHMYGSTIGTLNVKISSGTTSNIIFSKSGNQGNRWEKASVHFISYSKWKVTFEAIAGSSFTSDIAIDDTSFIPGSCPSEDFTTMETTTWRYIEDIRLVNGTGSTNGRVEVFYSGQWGTVCDDGWDIQDATVVCRELGFAGARRTFGNAYFGEGYGPIWMDEVYCYGYESSLSECGHNGFGNHDCSHSEDAGVECVDTFTTSDFPETTSFTQPTQTTSFTQPTQLNCTFESDTCGFIQEVNDDFNWTRHRGSTGSTNTGPSGDHTNGAGWYMYIETSSVGSYARARLSSSFQPPTDPSGACLTFYYHMYGSAIGTLNVYISSGIIENLIFTVSSNQGDQWLKGSASFTSYSQWKVIFEGIDGTSYTGDIAIDDISLVPGSCSTQDPAASIRLVGGTSPFEGRVEILHNGVWGTVCDDYWDMNEARVVCRQLGFRAEAALRYAYFGQGSGQIWLDDLQCTGSEPSLDQCSHNGYGVHNCGHSEDASVRCTDPGEDIILRCGPSSFQVDIPRELIGGTHYASDFYLSGDPFDYNCRGFYNGNWYISLNSSLTGCGTRSDDTGNEILYDNVVEISDLSGGNSIVDFLGVEIPITCEYNSSERLHTHFKTLSSVIRKTAKGSFNFDFAMYTDISYTLRYYTYPVETRLNEDLYFRAELLQSASNLELHLRSCRATPSPDYDDSVVYEFINAGCGINNAPVRVLTPNQPTQADFEISSFRFRSDLGNPESQVWVHCEVVVCDVNDTNSECRQGCEQSRYRRSVESPPVKVHRMVQGPIVLKGENGGESETVIRTEDNNGSPSTFTEILSGVSLVMLIGLVVMGVALTKVIRNSATRGYQPLPNPSGITTA